MATAKKGRDHERTNLDIWGDEDWLDVSPAAQHLYFVLKTSAKLTYCGAGEWHPGRIATRAKGWTAAAVEHAAAELSAAAGRFVVIDVDSEEYLLRSWIKHDGLWRIPNMAVSMANDRSDLCSRMLRAVVVHEVRKLAAANPDISSWERSAVAKMLTQNAVDPYSLPVFNPTPNSSSNPPSNPWVNPPPNPPSNGRESVNRGVGVNPPPNPGPTPSPSPTPDSSYSNRGYVSTEGNQRDGSTTPHCPKHPDGRSEPCGACADARRIREDRDRANREQQRAQREAEQQAAHEAKIAAIALCGLCDDEGYRGGRVCDHVDRLAIAKAGAAKARAALAKSGDTP